MNTADKTAYLTSLAPSAPGSLAFFGPEEARLFTLEVGESLRGVLEKSFDPSPDRPQDHFVTTSVDGRVCSDHLWSRDAGTLLRELAQWGYLGHASFLANLLLDLVAQNEAGYYTFPMYFLRGQRAAGSELDGTGAAIIGLVLLWKRLGADDPLKQRISAFITGDASPVRYVLTKLESDKLIAGSGEFGGGMGVSGEYYNVVQNYLVYLMLKAAEDVTDAQGDTALSQLIRQRSTALLANIEAYLIGNDHAWLWCINPDTLRADPAVLEYETNPGFGGVNGVLAMHADVFGFDLASMSAPAVEASRNTFDALLRTPLRREQYEKYGMWTQFDVLNDGLLTSPSYGQGYALQAALLMDALDMAERLAGYLARATVYPQADYKLDRDNPYHFYERMLSPDYAGIATFDQGCGALNLVNVAEPLKAARLIAGIDDTSAACTRIIPRLPVGWQGYAADHWPILTAGGPVMVDIRVERQAEGYAFSLKNKSGTPISRLQVRLPDGRGGWTWYSFQDATDVQIGADSAKERL